jgi:hypothetical protein
VIRHEGRSYWPVMDPIGRQLDVKTFMRDLRGPPPTGRKIRGPGSDPLGRTAALHGRNWPASRLEAVPVKTLVETARDAGIAALHRAAADLLVVGRQIYRRGSEPVWLVRCDINRFATGAQPLFMDAIDFDPAAIPSDGREMPVPFLHYEIFRADRESDARDLVRLRLALPGRERDYCVGRDCWRIEGDATPDFDALTPMLRALHECVHGMTTWGLETLRRERPDIGGLSDGEVAAGHAPDWVRRIHGLQRLPEGASARRLSAWISECLGRLDGVDVRVDIYGWVETVLLGLRRAADRADRDIAAGLVPLTDEDREDDGPLALLACA